MQLRFEGGLTSEMVYQQAKVEYASTAALIPDLERKIKIMENGILLLMGENPDRRVVRGKMNTDAEFADSLPVGLPSGLLQRRPDVRSSEQRLRAAMAAAGMAYADRFPRLTFNLTGGLENDALSGFFRSPFSYVAGTLASPIFGFGRKQARYRAALAAYDEARLAYEQKVLTVFKEADDAVITYRSARKTAALKLNLRDAASKYVELAHLQYRAGSTNYIDVLDAQRRYFDAQIGLSNSVSSVSPELYEAAAIDGAGIWQRIIHIMIPAIKKLAGTLLILQIISVFQIMYEPMVLTKGGPDNASLSLMQLMWQYAFGGSMNYGKASAVACVSR